jgi:hypothetical protein
VDPLAVARGSVSGCLPSAGEHSLSLGLAATDPSDSEWGLLLNPSDSEWDLVLQLLRNQADENENLKHQPGFTALEDRSRIS